jgi:very-short-patch-repair endonuclease
LPSPPIPSPEIGRGGASRILYAVEWFAGKGSLPSPKLGRGAGGEGCSAMNPNHNRKTSGKMRALQPEVHAAARTFRRSPTQAERVLWQALRDRQLAGLKFRRQHAVGRVVLDFYCPSHRLAIEVDGSTHDNRIEEDEARTAHLAAYGYLVVRFRNEEVLTDLGGVLRKIVEATISGKG